MSDTVPAIPPGMVANALTVDLDYEPVPLHQVVAGSPRTGYLDWGSWSGLEVGVWEMTEGAMRDTEVEEMFVVVSGEATLTRTRGESEETVELFPGVVCHLEAGENNLWDVRVPLRKIYFAPAG